MLKKKNFIIFFVLFLMFIFVILLNFTSNNKRKNITKDPEIQENKELIYQSNIIENVNYTTKDVDGNEYIISALKGEIDYEKPNILYLTKINALIKLKNSESITITSDYGKYNSENFDTIFSKNVIINYLENKITSEYLDFSLERNSMIISKKVVYNNLKNILYADVIELDIKSKDTKVFMYEREKKVKIKSKN